MKNKLLIISGPTATGKTHLALKIAKKFNGEIVSADSRQVYKYMNIVTGKDIPADTNIKIWGYNILRPDQDANASWYAGYARKVVANIWSRKKLPIVVGGTGFYISALLGKYPLLDVPTNPKLRQKLASLDNQKLYKLLLQFDSLRAQNLNNSDKNNNRRLIRAIEVARYSKASKITKTNKLIADILWIGLKLPPKKLKEKINKRVFKRLGPAMDKEIKVLQAKGYINAAPAKTLGYQQWLNYLNGNCTKEEAIEQWIKEEYKYAKRQITWFKKQPEIIWFNVDDKDLNKKLSAKVEKWYSNDR